MAQFIGYVKGSRGEASRLGSSASGIRAQAQGWNVGVLVDGHVFEGQDVFNLYATSGSSGSGSNEFIGTVKIVDGKPTFV
jgi:hypothetical protein